jgi:hypothetical protein
LQTTHVRTYGMKDVQESVSRSLPAFKTRRADHGVCVSCMSIVDKVERRPRGELTCFIPAEPPGKIL